MGEGRTPGVGALGDAGAIVESHAGAVAEERPLLQEAGPERAGEEHGQEHGGRAPFLFAP